MSDLDSTQEFDGLAAALEDDQDPPGTITPTAVLEGTFALYPDGQGGYVLVTYTEAHGLDRKHIPAALVKMATGGGVIGRRFAGLFGR